MLSSRRSELCQAVPKQVTIPVTVSVPVPVRVNVLEPSSRAEKPSRAVPCRASRGLCRAEPCCRAVLSRAAPCRASWGLCRAVPSRAVP